MFVFFPLLHFYVLESKQIGTAVVRVACLVGPAPHSHSCVSTSLPPTSKATTCLLVKTPEDMCLAALDSLFFFFSFAPQLLSSISLTRLVLASLARSSTHEKKLTRRSTRTSPYAFKSFRVLLSFLFFLLLCCAFPASLWLSSSERRFEVGPLKRGSEVQVQPHNKALLCRRTNRVFLSIVRKFKRMRYVTHFRWRTGEHVLCKWVRCAGVVRYMLTLPPHLPSLAGTTPAVTLLR